MPVGEVVVLELSGFGKVSSVVFVGSCFILGDLLVRKYG